MKTLWPTHLMRGLPREIERIVPAKQTGGPVVRLVGSLDIDGNGTFHDELKECDPCILLDRATITKNAMPPFGNHPHSGHSVVTCLIQGKYKSWDSTTQEDTYFTGPASCWVNAGTGLFHNEISVIDDETDVSQHINLYQLWIGVTPEERQKPPSISLDEDLPVQEIMSSSDGDDEETKKIATIRYYVGEGTKIQTPAPLTVCHVHQYPQTTLDFPIPARHTGFAINACGMLGMDPAGQPATFGGTATPTNLDDVLVLKPRPKDDAIDDNVRDYLQVTTGEAPSDYMIVVGEPHNSPWFKKLVANGAVFGDSEDAARALASRMDKAAQTGKETGSYAPFGK